MAAQGYGRTIPEIDGAGNPVTANLPTGLYYGSSTALAATVEITFSHLQALLIQ